MRMVHKIESEFLEMKKKFKLCQDQVVSKICKMQSLRLLLSEKKKTITIENLDLPKTTRFY